MEPWVYSWGLLFEHSITSYWTGDARGSLAACDRLLALPDLPDNFRQQTISNRRFAADRVAAGTGRSAHATFARTRTA